MAFIGAGSPLVAAGVLLYLYALVAGSTDRQARAARQR
jgi:hypothetical protein